MSVLVLYCECRFGSLVFLAVREPPSPTQPLVAPRVSTPAPQQRNGSIYPRSKGPTSQEEAPDGGCQGFFPLMQRRIDDGQGKPPSLLNYHPPRINQPALSEKEPRPQGARARAPCKKRGRERDAETDYSIPVRLPPNPFGGSVADIGVAIRESKAARC